MKELTIICDNNGCGRTVDKSGWWRIVETDNGYQVRLAGPEDDDPGYDVCSDDCLVRMESKIRSRVSNSRKRET